MVRVIDGDSLDVGGVAVRLHGVDAPEVGQTCLTAEGQSWHCGDWARRQVRDRYQGANARCDARDRDIYDRVVATCYVAGGDVGKTLVENGIALAFRKYSMVYDLEEKNAAAAGRGVHRGDFHRPGEHRKARRAAKERCLIKGNIAKSGERIFHLPGQRFYDATRIHTKEGERWFCSKRDAERAGWRKARS